jgi:hypothetical protein
MVHDVHFRTVYLESLKGDAFSDTSLVKIITQYTLLPFFLARVFCSRAGLLYG